MSGDAIAIASLTGTPPLANERRRQVSCRARTQACSALVSAASRGPVCGSDTRAIATLPMIAIRMLLKSWAMPPASRPSDSSLLALACSAWTLSASLMSRNASTIPIVRPEASRSGAAISSIGCSVRSRATSTVQRPGPGRSDSAERADAAVAPGARLRIEGLKHGAERLPDRFFWLQPVSLSATSLISNTTPSRSVVMTPSPMLRSVTARRSFSCSSACSARLA